MKPIHSFNSNKGIVSRLVVQLEISQQLWLPFDAVRQANIHEYARRFGIQVTTRTVMKGGIRGIRIKRVA
jgi:hypothetical protein